MYQRDCCLASSPPKRGETTLYCRVISSHLSLPHMPLGAERWVSVNRMSLLSISHCRLPVFVNSGINSSYRPHHPGKCKWNTFPGAASYHTKSSLMSLLQHCSHQSVTRGVSMTRWDCDVALTMYNSTQKLFYIQDNPLTLMALISFTIFLNKSHCNWKI